MIPALLVSLDKLPGFDPVGLWVRPRVYPQGQRWLVTQHLPAGGQYKARCMLAHGGPYNPGADDSDLKLDLSDRRTRAAVAHWLAERIDYADRHNGLHFVYVNGIWWLEGPGDGFNPRWDKFDVPALADIDPTLPDLLPDGSRRVDAEALALVAVHVGAA